MSEEPVGTAETPDQSSLFPNLKAVAAGELDGYPWRSRTHQGMVLDVVFVKPGEEPPAQEPKEHWREYEPYLDGKMSAEEAQAMIDKSQNPEPQDDGTENS